MVSEMKKTAYPILASISTIASEMHVSVAVIKAKLSEENGTILPEDINGILFPAKMAGLRSLVETCKKLQNLIEFKTGNVNYRDETISDTLSCIGLYVKDLANGSLRAGTYLYDVYIRCCEITSEISVLTMDEFYLPSNLDLSDSDGMDFMAEALKYSGILESIQNDVDQPGLDISATKAALMTLEAKNPSDKTRLFISMAICSLESFEGVTQEGDAAFISSIFDLVITRLKMVGENGDPINEKSISVLLSVIAQSVALSSRAKKIWRYFDIEILNNATTSFEYQNKLELFLAEVDKLHDLWEKISSCSDIREDVISQVSVIVDASFALGLNSVNSISKKMSEVISFISNKKDVSEDNLIFVASMIIAIKDISIQKDGHGRDDQLVLIFEDSANELINYGQTNLVGRTSENNTFSSVDIFSAMADDFAIVEKCVESLVLGQNSDVSLSVLTKHISYIENSLRLIGEQKAFSFSRGISDRIRNISLNEHEQISSVASEELVSAVFSLGEFISKAKVTGTSKAFEFNEFDVKKQDTPSALLPGDHNDNKYSDRTDDEELAGIFYEEAIEVVESIINPAVNLLEIDRSSSLSISNAKRGFHTLKGSAKMVQLGNLGMVAQNIEQVLGQRNIGTIVGPMLISWLRAGANEFNSAIKSLRNNGFANISLQKFNRVHDDFMASGVFYFVDDGDSKFDQIAESIVASSIFSDISADIVEGNSNLRIDSSPENNINDGVPVYESEVIFDSIIDTQSSNNYNEMVLPDTLTVASLEIPPTSVEVIPEDIMEKSAVNIITDNLKTSLNFDVVSIVESKNDDVDLTMFEIFKEEADQRFTEIDECLSGLTIDISNKKLFNTLKRSVHTLKGSSNTTGARKVGAIFHYLEDLIDNIASINHDQIQVVQFGVDAAFEAIKAIKLGKSVDRAIEKFASAKLLINSTTDKSDSISSSGAVDSHDHSPQTSSGTMNSLNHVGESKSLRTVQKQHSDGGDDEVLRVPIKSIDGMVKSVSEVNVMSGRVVLNLKTCKTSLSGLSLAMENLSVHLRQIELEAEKQMLTGPSNLVAIDSNKGLDALHLDRFTKLQELTRQIAEAQDDMVNHRGSATSSLRDLEETIASQFVLMKEVTGDLDSIRQVRVSSVVPSLKRVVRQACRDSGKSAEIFFDADVQIDRGILSRITGPIEHILRNAIAHGIESQSERQLAHKEEVGTIEFRSYRAGSEIVIEIRDDGNGIDTKQVLSRAVEKGVVVPEANLTDVEVMNLLFEPGFSTAETVTELSGRGVGLDVVRTEVEEMGGTVTIASSFGFGASFTIRVPMTLSVIPGASVTTMGCSYVLPATHIEKMIRCNEDVVVESYKTGILSLEDDSGNLVDFDFWGLWELVDVESKDSAIKSKNSIIILRGERIAIHVEDIRPAEDFVFQSIGEEIAPNRGIIGSTIDSFGRATLVLDISKICKHFRSSKLKSDKNDFISLNRMPLVLVVDDSLTVRSAAARLLKKKMVRSVMAENGLVALDKIREERPDVILMDIEMPVMNGFEATAEIRKTEGISDIPIIFVTSRVGDVHREQAFEIGASDYIGKPFDDEKLFMAIRKYL